MGVWRSVTTMSGAQCVMTSGVLLMLMWSADSWDSVMTQVNLNLMTSSISMVCGGQRVLNLSSLT